MSTPTVLELGPMHTVALALTVRHSFQASYVAGVLWRPPSSASLAAAEGIVAHLVTTLYGPGKPGSALLVALSDAGLQEKGKERVRWPEKPSAGATEMPAAGAYGKSRL